VAHTHREVCFQDTFSKIIFKNPPSTRAGPYKSVSFSIRKVAILSNSCVSGSPDLLRSVAAGFGRVPVYLTHPSSSFKLQHLSILAFCIACVCVRSLGQTLSHSLALISALLACIKPVPPNVPPRDPLVKIRHRPTTPLRQLLAFKKETEPLTGAEHSEAP